MTDETMWEGEFYPDRHHTVGYRAWCFGCGEWCYPHDSCSCCYKAVDEMMSQCWPDEAKEVNMNLVVKRETDDHSRNLRFIKGNWELAIQLKRKIPFQFALGWFIEDGVYQIELGFVVIGVWDYRKWF